MAKGRTKLESILNERNLSQTDLVKLIEKKVGKSIGNGTISKIVAGKVIDYWLRTAGYIAYALDVDISDIIEPEILNPNYNAEQ